MMSKLDMHRAMHTPSLAFCTSGLLEFLGFGLIWTSSNLA